MQKNTTLLLALAMFLAVCLLATAFFYLESTNLTTFVVEAKKISELPPHPHEPSLDSISDDNHHKYVQSETFITPYDLWIKGFNAKVINANDTIVHHLFLGRTDKKDELCPNYNWQAIFVTSEVNAYPQVFPGKYAMFLPKGTPLKIFGMLHNASPPLGPGKSFHNVSIQVQLYTQRDSPFNAHLPIQYHRLHLSDKPCMDAERAEIFEVPPYTKEFIKKNSYTNGHSTSSYVFPKGGTIVGMGGHFHPFEGGENVKVDLNGKNLDTFTATEISHGNWKSWHIPILPYFLNVRNGDTISISSKYSNPNPFPVRGAMGMVVVYFSQDNK